MRKPTSPDGRGPAGATERWYGAALAMLALAALLATRGYRGIRHDGLFYAGQALHELGHLGDDLFFAGGSQDSFSMFSAVYAPLAQMFGIGGAALALWILGMSLWVAAALWLARVLTRSHQEALWAGLGILLLSGFYSADLVLTYAEGFTTARPFAEAAAMAALAAFVTGRRLAALGATAVGLALHPLMILPAAAMIFLVLAERRRAWWLLAAAAVPACLALAWAEVQPFAKLTQSFDPAWRSALDQRNRILFLGRNDLADGIALLSRMVLALLLLRLLDGPMRLLLRAALITTVLGLAATALGADLAGNVLLTTVQPWRATWLLALLSNMGLAVLLLRAVRGEGPGWLSVPLLAMAAANLALAQFGIAAVASLTLGLTLLAAARRDALPRLAVPLAWASGAAVALHAVSLTPSLAANRHLFALLLVVAMAATAWAWLRGRLAGPAIAGLCVFLLTVSAVKASKHSGFERYLASERPLPAAAAPLLRPGARVFWPDGIELMWLKGRQANYVSVMQGAGLVFNRWTAVEYMRRIEVVRPLMPATFEMCSLYCTPENPAAKATPEAVAAVCGRGELDYVVLSDELAGAAAVVELPVPPDHQLVQTNRFFVYACAGRG